uniref:Uncharacterized protein n=1 Tax=Aegilops tauschii subsp. strangulata TaxID=200361 RepID=A0A452ZEG2_AEGTS
PCLPRRLTKSLKELYIKGCPYLTESCAVLFFISRLSSGFCK